ncbi:MAG: Rid family hydrolase [Anderseniella sp.]
MAGRVHVPFDVFAMRVSVPVSTMVRDGAFGWSCGQCPLTPDGEVFEPGDLQAQARFVCSMIETVVDRAYFKPAQIGKLHVYYVPSVNLASNALADLFAVHFSHGPLIVLIPVPHFYYAGMLIEVDVFAAETVSGRAVHQNGGVAVKTVATGDQTWAQVMGGHKDRGNIETALISAGLRPECLLSGHWFSETTMPILVSGHSSLSDAMVMLPETQAGSFFGVLTFVNDTVETQEILFAGRAEIHRRRAVDKVWVTGTCSDAGQDLVQQTRSIMTGIDVALGEVGMTFANVAKLTAHYTGGASEEELHGNMQVRHGFYIKPGPASTGLPVHGLGNQNCRIAIDVLAV